MSGLPNLDGRKRSTASRSDSNSYAHMNFADPSDFIDNISDEELLTDILKNKPSETNVMDSIVIVDGLPMVPPERLDKLKTVVKRIMTQHAEVQPTDIVNEIYPADENNVSKGFAFYEFIDSDAEPSIASRVQKILNGYKFDKQHTLSVDFFPTFDKYMAVSDEAEEPAVRPFKNPGNLRYWLENEDCYDHYVVLWGGNTGAETMTAYANSPVEPTLLENRQHWTDRYAIWSPLGTYLATFHQKGLALWGGPGFTQITRFAHEHVINAAFSPNERYILTMRNKPEHLPVDDQSMILWDVVTAAKKKSFAWDQKESPSPNYLKWSPDENYFATMTRNEAINIYNTKTFTRVVRDIPGVADFAWSSAQNYLVYWVRESISKDVPARVVLLYVPPADKDSSRALEETRSKQLFSVKECAFYWQKNGEYMAVKVLRYKHVKKKGNAMEYGGLYNNLEIFTLTSRKEVPVESIEIKDPIVDLAWEPNGSKLVVLTVAESITSASFYSRLGERFELVKKLSLRHKVEKISWSPMGQFVVLHTLASGSVGYLIFVDTSDLSVLADVEHFLLSDVQWDPTGRFLTAITASSGGNKKDNGFTLYSFQGRYIRNEKVDGLSMFTWRPRPPSLLPPEKLKEVKKNLKKYAVEFDAKDRMLANKASKEVSERRKRQMNDFMDFLTRKQRLFEQGRNKRVELRRGTDTEAMDAHPDELVEEQLEIMINMTVTTIE